MAITSEQILAARPVRRLQIAAVGLIVFGLLVDGIDIQSLAYAAPLILTEWSVTSAEFSIAAAAALAGMAVGNVMGGALGDRLGRRRVVVGSAVLFGLAMLGTAAVHTVPLLAVLRFVGGIGFGAFQPNAFALATELLPRRAHARAISVLSIGTPLGSVLGGLLALVVLPTLGWRALFLCCAGLSLAVALLCRVVLPESPGFLLTRGRDEAATRALGRVAGLRPAERESLALVAEESAHSSLRGVFQKIYLRVNVGLGIGYFTIQFFIFAIVSWLPAVLTGAGFDLALATTATVTFSTCNMLGALGSAFVLGRVGSRTTVVAGAVVGAAALVPVPALIRGSAEHGLPLLLLCCLVAAGLASGMVITAFANVAVHAFDSSCRSSGLGLGLTFGRLGAVVTVVSSGVLLTLTSNDLDAFFWLVAGAGILAGAAAFVIDRHVPSRAAQQRPRVDVPVADPAA